MKLARRLLLILAVAFGVTAPMAFPQTAQACPMCKAANETDDPDGTANMRPQAYMYSILFMLSMPAALLGAFGVSIWRMTRKYNSSSEL